MLFVRIVVFCLLGAVASLGMVIAANKFYTKIGTYHPTRYHEEGEEDSEHIGLKWGRLWVYNFTVVLSTAGLIFLYTLSPVGQGSLIPPEAWIALLLVSLFMTFSIRVCSLAKITSGQIYHRAIGFGHSFILSIYFISLFGAGAHIVQKGFTIPSTEFPEVGEWTVIALILVLLLGPVVSTLCSELILHPDAIDVEQKDEYNAH